VKSLSIAELNSAWIYTSSLSTCWHGVCVYLWCLVEHEEHCISFYCRKIISQLYRNKVFIQEIRSDKQLEKKSLFVESPLLLHVISQRDTELSAMGDINSNPPFYCLPLSLLML